jgi:ribosomal protein L23
VTTFHKDHRDVLIAPVVSEKSYGLLDENKYTFLVAPDANKTEIKIAVEKVFNVKVTASVNTINRQGKRAVPASAPASAGHQARDRQPRRGPAHRHLRRSGLLTAGRADDWNTWESASTSRRPRADVARRRRLRRGHAHRAGEVAGPPPAQEGRPQQLRAASPPVTRVAATSAPTA